MISLVIKKRLDAKPGDETEREYITTDELDAEGDEITVHKADYPEAFPAPDVLVCGSFLTWGQVDALRNAIDAAEKLWRGKRGKQERTTVHLPGFVDGDIVTIGVRDYVLVEKEKHEHILKGTTTEQVGHILYKVVPGIVDGDVIMNPKRKKFVIVDEARYSKLIHNATLNAHRESGE